MDAYEIVEREVERQLVKVVFELLSKPVRQAGEAPHRHTHRKILAFDKRCRDIRDVGVSFAADFLDASAFARAVATPRGGRAAIELHKLGIVHVAAKRALDRLNIRAVSILGNLNALSDTVAQIACKLERLPGQYQRRERRWENWRK